MVKREKRQVVPAAQRREQILKAALAEFINKGYEAATIPVIAGRAGVAAGTIYLYFPGKRELFIAVVENLLIKPLGEIFDRVNPDFPATIKEVLENRLNLIESDFISGLPFLMSQIIRDPELREMFLTRLIQPFLKQIENFFQNRVAAGEFRPQESALTTRAVGGMIIGLAILRCLEQDASPLDNMPRETVVGELLNFILFGLSPVERSEKIE